ncbi:MAG: DUF2442 domain-containing protein [Bacteroidia bacterium]|nr:DUF2442 domain-containing protein [Paludibacteraceae bacterium]MDD2996753.1 DUF2442 domain-containing protein [Paludibacter sp.]NCB69934.1 DUF2442 domain-containing protein [Bacteroidia bacterium]
MYLAVINVEPLANYQLKLTFQNAEIRVFDMQPYLNLGIFNELKDESLFNTVHISFDTIAWNNEADMDPEILYAESVALECPIASEPKAQYRIEKDK